MKKFTLITAISFGMAIGAFAQTGNEKQASPEEAAMMKKWEAYMTPGEMHKMIAKSDGDWNEDITMWMAPGAPPTKSTSTCTNKMIMGGRYQESVHHGNFNGMPFEGISTMGYDNEKKIFQSTWIDNMGTGIMYMEGNYNADTKTMESRGKMVDPMSGSDKEVRQVFKIIDDNTQMMTMYETAQGGKEFKSMEIKLTRK